MFEIGWTEMLVIAIVMIVVVGPKDLPKMLRTFGKTTAKLRSMAGDFQRQFNEALKEAELDDVKKSVDSLRSLNPANEIKKQLNPFEKAASEVRAGLDTLKPKPPEPAVSETHSAEPVKGGAAAMPGEQTIAQKSTPAPVQEPAPAAGSPDIKPEPAPKKPSASKPAAGKTAARKPAAAKPATVKPVAKTRKPAAKKPAGPMAEKPPVTAGKPKAAPRKKKTEGSAT